MVASWDISVLDEQLAGSWLEGREGLLTHSALHEARSLVWWARSVDTLLHHQPSSQPCSPLSIFLPLQKKSLTSSSSQALPYTHPSPTYRLHNVAAHKTVGVVGTGEGKHSLGALLPLLTIL